MLPLFSRSRPNQSNRQREACMKRRCDSFCSCPQMRGRFVQPQGHISASPCRRRTGRGRLPSVGPGLREETPGRRLWAASRGDSAAMICMSGATNQFGGHGNAAWEILPQQSAAAINWGCQLARVGRYFRTVELQASIKPVMNLLMCKSMLADRPLGSTSRCQLADKQLH